MGDFLQSMFEILAKLLLPFVLAYFIYIAFLIYRNIKLGIWAEKLQQSISQSRHFVKDWESISADYWEEARNSHPLLKSPIVAAYRQVMTLAFLDRRLAPPESVVDLPRNLPFRLQDKERPLFWCEAKTVVMKQFGTRVAQIKTGKNTVVATTWGLHFMDGLQARSIPRNGFDVLNLRAHWLDVQSNRPESTRYALRCNFNYEQVLYKALTAKLKTSAS